MSGYTRKGVKDFVSAAKPVAKGTSRVAQVQAQGAVQKQLAPFGTGQNLNFLFNFEPGNLQSTDILLYQK